MSRRVKLTQMILTMIAIALVGTLFLGGMVGGQMRLENGRLTIVKPGKIKLVDRVREITFNGERALKSGRGIFYVTNVGVFKLTPGGLELVRVVPGIDVRRDILEPSNNAVKLPASGEPSLADASVMTGEGFTIRLKS